MQHPQSIYQGEPMRSEESRKKTSDAIKAWHASMSPEQKEQRRKKFSETILNLPEEVKEERRRRLSEAVKAVTNRAPNSPRTTEQLEETRLRMSNAAKRYFEGLTEEQKAERSKKLKDSMTSEVNKKRTESRKKFNQEHPGHYNKSPEHRQKISDSVSKGILEGKGNGYFKNSKRGTHLSPKAGKVYYRSAYELKAFEMLDLDEKVKTYTHDSYRIPYRVSNGTRYYILDLTVFYVDNSVKYVEVKPKDFLEMEDVKAKILIAQEHLGPLFEVWTEKELGIEDPTKLYR